MTEKKRERSSAGKKDNYQIYLRQINALARVARLISSGMYLDELLKLIVHVTAEVMQSKICSLMLLDPETKELVIKSTQSVSERYNNKPNIKLGEGIAGMVAKDNKLLCSRDVRKDRRYVNREIARSEAIVSLASVPLAVKGKVIGALNCYTSEEHEFSPAELDILTTVAAGRRRHRERRTRPEGAQRRRSPADPQAHRARQRDTIAGRQYAAFRGVQVDPETEYGQTQEHEGDSRGDNTRQGYPFLKEA